MRQKYRPLQNYLENQDPDKNEVALTFQEIENLIGAYLPKSAHEYREWWSNQSDVTNRPQAKAWTDAGFKVKDVNQSKNQSYVKFERV